MTEPLRPTPTPCTHSDGRITTCSTTSSPTFGVRACVHVHSSKVIPIIFVPGIMGSNIKTDSRKTKQKSEQAWRPPNGKEEATLEVGKWRFRSPKDRQELLSPDSTVVDEDGPIKFGGSEELFRKRGWGSVHLDSYGSFLFALHNDLNRTYESSPLNRSAKILHPHWEAVVRADRKKWGAADMPPLTESELKKFSEYQYPVYAVGYNWLRSCAEAAEILAQKIDTWIKEWKSAGFQCDKVILVSHSLGGLVCRAYAKEHASDVLGVIHGVLPAVGAPLCYRRIACGTERTKPGGGFIDVESQGFSIIAGRTPAETQPVLAVSPGPLELLPCHLHPAGWLKAYASSNINERMQEVLSLPKTDPYKEIYQEMSAWYRLINSSLIDPGGKHANYKGLNGTGSLAKCADAIRAAEMFHKKSINSYYHPNTYVFYCHDPAYMSFGTIRWAGSDGGEKASPERLARAPEEYDLLHPIDMAVKAGIDTGKWLSQQGRDMAASLLKVCGMQIPDRPIFLSVLPQDAPGDGTVAWQSGSAPTGKSGVKRVFRTTGYSHQGGFNDPDMRLLTFHLICKIVQEAS